MKHSVSSWARATGYALAGVQHGLDTATEWALGKVRQSSAAPAGSKAKGGNPFLRFVGEAGEAYYKTYTSLKKNRP